MLTNCIYILSLGYICKWKNLHRYSQQGWESLNSLIKCFFFQNTNKRGVKAYSGLILILRSLQRRLSWMSGIGDIILNEYNKNKMINIQELFPSTKIHSTDDSSTINEEIDDMHCLNTLDL